MNNGRMWCVVNPTVGLPLFIGGVALTSLTVHHYVLSNTSWVGDFWKGSSKASAAVSQVVPQGSSPVVLRTEDGKAAFTINVTPAAGDSSSFVLKVERLPGDLALAATDAK